MILVLQHCKSCNKGRAPEKMNVFFSGIAKVTSSFMKSSLNHIRIKSFVRKEHLSKTLDTMDTLIVQKNSKSPQFDDILKMITTRKRQKSILVVMESEVEDFKVSRTSFACLII